MFKKTIYQKIYQKIKQYDTIVIARHVGADPDALASSIALRDMILNQFPKKNVYAVGFPVSRLRYLGELDKFTEELYENALLIVTDTPDKKRVDGVDPARFKESIKIDHHPYIETFCNLEWIDDKASSASQMIIELALHTKLGLTKEAAKKLYLGIVADTNRFLFYYTTPKTFDLVSQMIKMTNLDFTSLYESLYMRSMKELKLISYIVNHFTITEHGLAYLSIADEVLEEYGVDAATARNMVSEFNYLEEVIVWGLFTKDKNSGIIRGSLRSRGPIINEVASHYGGGGHIYASGARPESEEQLKALIEELDQLCKTYQEKKES